MQLAAHLYAMTVLGAAIALPLGAQPSAAVGIYTCVDASGVRITSDRLIPQCADREQRVLGPTGVERQRIGPVLTEVEMAQRRELHRQQQLAQQRVQEQHRRDQALLMRYPNRAASDAQRQHSLQHAQALQDLALQRWQALQQQASALRQALQRYPDASQAPLSLHEQLNDVLRQAQAQQAVVAAHVEDVRRIHARFDAQLQRLQPLWDAAQPTAP